MSDLDEKSRRDLFRGSLDLMVLAVLADGPQYGYAIQRKVREASGESIQAGSLYPLLHRLETEGYVLPRWEKTTGRDRKWYELTPAGEKRLRSQAADWQAYLARLQALVLPAVRQITNHPTPKPTP